MKKDSRDTILSTATRLFQLQGYSATGLNQIIKESNAPKGSLYYHFPGGKEQLAVESINKMAGVIADLITSDFAEYGNVVEAIQIHIRKIGEGFDDIEHIEGIHIGLIAAETALKSEPLRQASKNAFDLWISIYEQKLIEDGYGEERAVQLSVLINSLIEGSITHALTYKNGDALRNAADFIPVLLKK
ncbi:TetR/AcrR family transcriptional regulator [Paenibacillus radicis (ex Gao et al. 2016)]|uniref:HTH-type transcriptional regulator LmrA n=1 Tax=Paenibacillus radicis (ex Gao et al. 2016) TaxID=1737354 RepID=A0A917LZX9_9BACL|nr:TetR/AcrR family transcriptional regulator [Paenibacillus radicis (ex Gao et al. 2016)]GGG68765.1 HTH-type transcriptional regulator LmrA [Paenibacillus radicis (ex Gao et al. 2016)]